MIYIIYFTSDLHFGHKNVIGLDNRPFKTVEEMDEELIKRWNNKVGKQDTVYSLGDMFWKGQEYAKSILKQLNGKIILIMGNHDRNSFRELISTNLLSDVKDYHEMKVDGSKLVLSHYPIHFYNGQHNDAIMLYGHVHNTHEEILTQAIKREIIRKNIPCEMYNCFCGFYNYEPVTLDEILERWK